MIEKLINLVSWSVAGVLLYFTGRRCWFTILALMPDQYEPGQNRSDVNLPHVLLLVPIKNEAQALPELLPALVELDYPPDKLTLVLIDDGSTDGSETLVQGWARERAEWHLLSVGQNLGKANALNLALSRFAQGEIVAIYDADERPLPDTLLHLVFPFTDREVGGVSGRRAVSNALTSPAASYSAFEGLVHQFVTMRAKDKAHLAPAILGANCAYRRSALAEVGNFKSGAFLEDSDLTLKLALAGWKTRFEPNAISYHRAPEKISGYWKQHTRWARGFNEVARDHAQTLIFDKQIPLRLRIELLTFSLGYLDRIALLVGGGLAVFGRNQRLLATIMLLSLLTPVVQIVAALKIGRVPLAMWGRVIWVPLFFVLDVAMSIAGLWQTFRKSPRVWEDRRAQI